MEKKETGGKKKRVSFPELDRCVILSQGFEFVARGKRGPAFWFLIFLLLGIFPLRRMHIMGEKGLFGIGILCFNFFLLSVYRLHELALLGIGV